MTSASNYTQVKLIGTEVKKVHQIIDLIDSVFEWKCTEEGVEYWTDVQNKLKKKAQHGTSDGKPLKVINLRALDLRDPTEQDAIERRMCLVKDVSSEPQWTEATLLATLDKPYKMFVVQHKDNKVATHLICQIYKKPEEQPDAKTEVTKPKAKSIKWRTPTDLDAMREAQCRVKSTPMSADWRNGVLFGITKYKDEYIYMVKLLVHDDDELMAFRVCQVREVENHY